MEAQQADSLYAPESYEEPKILKEPDIVYDDPTSADISETLEEASLSMRLQAALQSLSQDTRNSLLLQAAQHYVQIKHFRDNLLVRVGLLDPRFGEFLLRESELEGQD